MNKDKPPPKGFESRLPEVLAPFIGICPRLLPGEVEDNFYKLFDIMTAEMGPTISTEWFAVAHSVDLLWDIQRYCVWKAEILNLGREDAFVKALTRTQPYFVPGAPPPKVSMAMHDAQQSRKDPAIRAALEARMAKLGYGDDTLNAMAFLEVEVPLAAIERFLSNARRQLNAIMKEIGVRREFADRVRKAFDEQLKLTVEVPKPKQIGPN
jgi:hypothetical protein